MRESEGPTPSSVWLTMGMFRKRRYGRQNCFRFANAIHNVKLVAQLLREVGSQQVVVIHAHPDSAPSVQHVAFEPTDELVEQLGLELVRY